MQTIPIKIRRLKYFVLAVHAIQPTYFILLHRFIALCREITFAIGLNESFGRSIS